MRTLEKLLELDGKIYIRLDNSETAKRFFEKCRKRRIPDAKRKKTDRV